MSEASYQTASSARSSLRSAPPGGRTMGGAGGRTMGAVRAESSGGAREAPDTIGLRPTIIQKDTVWVNRRAAGRRAGTAPAQRGGAGGIAGGLDFAVVGASELHSLLDRATIKTAAELEAEKRRRIEEDKEREARSRMRKAKMAGLEEERKKAALLSDGERIEVIKKAGINARAKDLLDEQTDEAKRLNQMILYSKVVTVRDAQIQEKRYLMQEKMEEEKQQDLLMEVERLKALKLYEERERKQREDQRSGARVIVEQIRGAQERRERDAAEQDLEREYILRQMQAVKMAEVEQQNSKRVAAQRLMDEVKQSNATSLRLKEERMLADKLEEQSILEYQMKKEDRQRQLEMEKQARAAAEEAEIGRLRAKQERASDKASEMDALRAKRAMEAAERQAREKDERESMRQQAIAEDMILARKQQQQEKEQRLAEHARNERDEFDRIVEVQIVQEQAEKSKAERERSLRLQSCHELRRQIAANEEKAIQRRRDELEEGNVVRARMRANEQNLNRIRDRKVGQLKKSGVPEKYWAELARQKL